MNEWMNQSSLLEIKAVSSLSSDRGRMTREILDAQGTLVAYISQIMTMPTLNVHRFIIAMLKTDEGSTATEVNVDC